MIYEVAKIVNQLKIENSFNLKMIKGTAEKIFDSYQIEVKKAFGKNIVSEYGSAESGLIAFECPNGSMHINMENVIVEEENNEIIVTNLNSYSFPIIRYKLGDYIRLEDKKFECPCGRAHPIIKDIFGRVGYKILGKNNIYPSLTLYYIFKNLSLIKRISLNYQAIQKERGKLILRIEQNNSEIYEHIKKDVEKYFNKDIEVEIQLGADLISKKGKRIDFISYLDEKK
jgi:phenylacetate-CoA ligase